MAAASLGDELQAVTETTGSGLVPYGALAQATIRDATRHGEGIGITFAEWAYATLNNGLGHYDKGRGRGRAHHR